MFGKTRQSLRKSKFKQGLDADDARRRREEASLEIRKNKREESLLKRRNMGNDQQPLPREFAEQLTKLPQFADYVKSDDQSLQHEGAVGLRKLLSIEHNPPIDDVIKRGVIPRLVGFLANHENPKLQFESAWALTNIGSGSSEQTIVLLQSGAVPAFVGLLKSEDLQVKEQAVWALGNIAGDSPNCRDYVLQFDVMPALLQMTKDTSRRSLQRNATWTISNLCRGKPAPPFHMVSVALQDLKNLLHSTDEQVLIDACWALSYLSDGDNMKIQTVMEAEVGLRVVELLMHSSPGVQTPALRVVGNIVTGDDIQTQCIINLQALPRLKALLMSSTKKGIRKEVCWTLSNITAGTPPQIQAVIDADLIAPLIYQLERAEFDIKKEAAWAIANATSSGTRDQVRYLVTQNCIPPLCELLGCADARIVAVALEGLENILEVGEKEREQTDQDNAYCLQVETCGGLDKIEALHSHPNASIFDKAVNIIQKYFGVADEDQNTTPNVSADQAQFGFGAKPAEGGYSF